MDLKGLKLNSSIGNYPPYSWKFGKHFVVSADGKAILNEKGFDIYTESAMTIIGGRVVGNVEIILSANQITSEIGIIENGNYQTVVRDQLFNFSLNYPILCEATYNHKNELIAAWTDDFNSPKVLNLTTLPFPNGLDADYGIANKEEFTLCELFPEIKNPSITDIEIRKSGGNIPSGVYQVCVGYVYDDDSVTTWQELSNPISIVAANLVTSGGTYNGYEGCAAGTTTSKSIKLTFSNLDTNFTRLRFAVVAKVGGVTTAYSSDNLYYTGNTKDIVITDLSTLYTASLAEVITPTAVYIQARAISLMNNTLLLGNLKGIPYIDYQAYANDISVQWCREEYASLNSITSSYKDAKVLFNKKSFKAGAVYALYAGLRLKRGGYYGIYHVPGRELATGEDTPLTTGLFAQIGNNVKTFQVKDTSRKISDYIGGMSAWQNENEVYPDDFPPSHANPATTFAGFPVRHHKFPDLAELESYCSDEGFIGDYNASSGLTESINVADPSTAVVEDKTKMIFLTADTPTYGTLDTDKTKYTATEYQEVATTIALTITTDLSTSFISVKLRKINANGVATVLYSKNLMHSYSYTVSYSGNAFLSIGESLELLVSSDSNVDFDPNGTLTFGVTLMDQVLDGTKFTRPLGIIVSNVVIPEAIRDYIDGWEIFYAERTVADMTIVGQDVLYDDTWNTGGFGYDNRFRIHAFDLLVNRLAIAPTYVKRQLDFDLTTELIDPAGSVISEFLDKTYADHKTTTDALRFIPVTFNGYYPALISSDRYDNSKREDALILDFSAVISNTTNHRHLADICVYKQDVYMNYQNQRLVSTGYFCAVDPLVDTQPSAKIYGGDIVISRYGFRMNYVDTTSKALIAHIVVESVSNIGFRYEGTATEEVYYPKSDQAALMTTEAIALGNYLAYNTDYNSVNNQVQPVIDYPNINRVEDFPNRIIRSLPRQTESAALAWRQFLISNYYEMVSDKGAINKLTGDTNKKLYIAHTYALYLASVKDTLDTVSGKIYLKENELFDREPIEIIPTEGGYIGNESRFATFMCKYGYFTVDKRRGKVFLISESSVDELTRYDVNEFFEQILDTSISDQLVDSDIEVGEGLYLSGSDSENLEYCSDLYTHSVDYDNPFVSAGITAGYDDKEDRFLLTGNNRTYRYINDGSVPGAGGATDEYIEEEPPATPTTLGGITVGTFDIENKSFTISYHPNAKIWICFHDYLVNYYLNTRKGLLGIVNNSGSTIDELTAIIYKFNSETLISRYGSIVGETYIDFVFDNKLDKSMMLESITWNIDVFNGRINYWDRTLTHVLVYTLNQCSGEITIVPKTWDNQLTTGNARRIKDDWIFNDFKDHLMQPNVEFIDINGDPILETLSGEEVDEILYGLKYVVEGISSAADYITYNSVNYTYNGARITPVAGVTTFTVHGNAIVKNFKYWYELSNFFTKFAIIRLKYDNIEQLRVKLNNVSLNVK